MTLEKHIVDTMKEWQIKMGSFDSNIRLYYPKNSLCHHLKLDTGIDNDKLCQTIEDYFSVKVKCLGKVRASVEGDRFCVLVGKEGCDYVEKEIPKPEFLTKFLDILKSQNMKKIQDFFEDYAKQHGTEVCICYEEESETIFYFENEMVEPYVYCIDRNEFGITYHRFTKEDYLDLGH